MIVRALQKRIALVNMSNDTRNIVIQCHNCDYIIMWNNNRLYTNCNNKIVEQNRVNHLNGQNKSIQRRRKNRAIRLTKKK